MANVINGEIELADGKKIAFELYPDVAPISVQNFVELAKKGFYDGLCFHRVIPNFMIQGGGFLAQGGQLFEKRAPKTIKGEFRSNGVANELKHTKGVLSMARTSVKDSASSQFFLCVADTPFLDGEYAAFGKVKDAQSQSIADAISKVQTTRVGYYDDVPTQPVVIRTIRTL